MGMPHHRVHPLRMRNPTLRPGTTLIELAIVLTLIAILLTVATPPLRRGADAVAARGARDALAAAVAQTRALAVARGGAALIVDPDRTRYRIEAPPGQPTAPPVDLGARYRVRLTLDDGSAVGGAGRSGGAARDPITLSFDPRGLGRMTNRTVHLWRGDARASLTLSAYGRPRRW